MDDKDSKEFAKEDSVELVGLSEVVEADEEDSWLVVVSDDIVARNSASFLMWISD